MPKMCIRDSADTICQRVTSKLSPGSIVLFHNAALHTPEALPAILDHMTREGYSLLPISQLIYRENYTCLLYTSRCV